MMMRQSCSVFVFATVCLVLAGTAHAGGTQARVTAQVKSVYVDYQGEANIVFVDDMSAAGDDYTCGNDKLDRVAVDPKTETGKAMYSMALAAFVSGKRISVVASGECTIKPDVFDVWYMYIID